MSFKSVFKPDKNVVTTLIACRYLRNRETILVQEAGDVKRWGTVQFTVTTSKTHNLLRRPPQKFYKEAEKYITGS